MKIELKWQNKPSCVSQIHLLLENDLGSSAAKKKKRKQKQMNTLK